MVCDGISGGSGNYNKPLDLSRFKSQAEVLDRILKYKSDNGKTDNGKIDLSIFKKMDLSSIDFDALKKKAYDDIPYDLSTDIHGFRLKKGLPLETVLNSDGTLKERWHVDENGQPYYTPPVKKMPTFEPEDKYGRDRIEFRDFGQEDGIRPVPIEMGDITRDGGCYEVKDGKLVEKRFNFRQ